MLAFRRVAQDQVSRILLCTTCEPWWCGLSGDCDLPGMMYRLQLARTCVESHHATMWLSFTTAVEVAKMVRYTNALRDLRGCMIILSFVWYCDVQDERSHRLCRTAEELGSRRTSVFGYLSHRRRGRGCKRVVSCPSLGRRAAISTTPAHRRCVHR